MKSIKLFAVACALASASCGFAGTITFEDAPSTYWNDSTPGHPGGQVDLGSFYPGVTFGAGAQIEHTSTVYPAHSGVLELFPSDIGNPTITVNFAHPQPEVSFWYTTSFGLVVTAYDSSNHQISQISPAGNVNLLTSVGTDSFADLIAPGGATIASISITDQSGLGNFFTIDDLSVPDATSTFALLGVAGLGLLAFRRKMVTQ